MMTRRAMSLVMAAAMLSAGSAASAQSLADVARKAAERRDAAQKPGKVYTNDSLTPDFTAPPASAEAATVEGEANPRESSEAEEATAVVDPGVAVPPKNERGEDYWRGRAARYHTRIASQRAKIESLQQRVDSMADVEGSTAARERDLTRARLSQAQSDLAHLEKEWVTFEATARSKNVPDAWIR